MKKILILLTLAFTVMSQSQTQELKQIPMINVTGEGKVKTAPDQACITISQETSGKKAEDVKKENDTKIDAILKFIKKMNIGKEDFNTQRVSLSPNYDYNTKKNNYVASQTTVILLKDLTKYDVLMDGLVEVGVNKIDNVEFKSSKILSIQSEARRLAVKDAKMKAEDFVSVLGQKVGKAITISDNSAGYNPQPVMYAMKAMAMSEDAAPKETLAAGEIEIVVNVSISFLLE